MYNICILYILFNEHWVCVCACMCMCACESICLISLLRYPVFLEKMIKVKLLHPKYKYLICMIKLPLRIMVLIFVFNTGERRVHLIVFTTE